MAENDYPLNEVSDRVDQAETDIDQNSSDIAEVENALIPVAGITAWHKNLGESLPANFVECNGQTVSDADSPLDGQTIPDLNDGDLLRGQTSSGGTDSFDTNGDNTSNTESVFEVVWIMRIK